LIEKIFSKDPVNGGRQKEIDLVKAYSIFMMILTHCIDELYVGYEDDPVSYIINDILAGTIGAQAFMICMGIGVVYSRSVSAKEYAKRGVGLLMTGQLLNIFRYAIPGLLDYFLTGDSVSRGMVFLVFSSDIMQFAGLFFIALGLLRLLKLKPWQVFGVSLAINLIGTFLNLKIHTGHYPLDQLFGLFIMTESESYFPFFNWFIYPAFGMLFGDILKHVKDKTGFYGALIVPCTVVWIAYYYIGLSCDQDFFKIFDNWYMMCGVPFQDAFIQLICNTALIAFIYFISNILPDRFMKGVNFVSQNINRYYCVHLVIISVIMHIPLVSGFETGYAYYVLAIVVFMLTSLVVAFYNRYLIKRVGGFMNDHKYLWYSVVMILSVAACVWSAAGVDVFPNLFNEYFIR